MKKIIAVTGLRGIPSIMGGVETHCEELYPLISDEFDVRIYARSPYVHQKSTYKNIKIIPVWTVANKYLETILHTFLCILRIALFERPDVLHIHAIGPGLLSPLAKILGLRVIVTHHGEDYRRGKWGFFSRNALKLGELLSLCFADRLIVVGKSLSEYLRTQYPKLANKIIYIPNGCPVVGHNQDSADNDVPLTDYILAVGRLVPEKGFHDLIAAYQQSDLAHKHVKLLIIGAADHHDKYSENLKKQESEDIIFLGKKDRLFVLNMLERASLFILPSYHEGLPISALEAISKNTRCLLSNISPNMDIGLEPSCYFEVGNVTALSEKLSGFSKIPFPSKDLLKKYEWSSISESYTKVVLELVK